MSNYDFSVIMSVYKNDKPEQLDVALDSIINQTLPPNEIIVVVDGPVPDESVRVLENKKQHKSIPLIELKASGVKLINLQNHKIYFAKKNNKTIKK